MGTKVWLKAIIKAGSESREYASRTLKAGGAAQPKGCSARFVVYKLFNFINF